MKVGSDARQGPMHIAFFMAYKASLGVRRVETSAEPKDVLMIDECDASRFSLL